MLNRSHISICLR